MSKFSTKFGLIAVVGASIGATLLLTVSPALAGRRPVYHADSGTPDQATVIRNLRAMYGLGPAVTYASPTMPCSHRVIRIVSGPIANRGIHHVCW